MTRAGDFEIPASDDGCLARARGLLLRDMTAFVVWVESDAAARRAVIATELTAGIEAWRDIFNAGRDICLAIEAREAALAALKGDPFLVHVGSKDPIFPTSKPAA